ncbi:MAG: tRNA (adenosine(37)-N6)-threonylcarbamoyltransferase complex dimerization subunit type 1 TsaB [Phycisphaeraceae bacterium]|nr:tRNA (adenosine(37)-N6)-threonylcarbamoyltransferase complex dimerization subunit type 1 TsaB [Phycisphaeraceae bacterium]
MAQLDSCRSMRAGEHSRISAAEQCEAVNPRGLHPTAARPGRLTMAAMTRCGVELALETTSRMHSMAVSLEGGPIRSHELPPGQRHEMGMVRAAADWLATLGLSASALQTLYISQGPGSFTGTRMALATAHMLAMRGGIKLVGVPTALALADAVNPREVNCPRLAVVMNIKHDTGCCQSFEVGDDGCWLPVDGLSVQPIESWLIGLRNSGDGIIAVLATMPLQAELGDGLLPLSDRWATPRADRVLAVGRRLAEGDGAEADLGYPMPIYGRRPEAVTLWEKRQQAGQNR